jgi:hypothetical protein
MTSYDQRRDQLALDSSIMVQVLLGHAPGDMEFVPLKPRPASDDRWTELRAQWPGRGLRLVGTIGLVDGAPKLALREPLDAVQVDALGKWIRLRRNVSMRTNHAPVLRSSSMRWCVLAPLWCGM